MLEPNSNKAKKEQKTLTDKPKAEKIITGTAKLKSKGIFDFIVSEDAASVKSYLVSDVLIPNVKRLIQELVTNGINQILYGHEYKPSRGGTNASHVSYNSYSNRNRPAPVDNSSKGYRDVEVSTYQEARDVLSNLQDIIDQYGMASVADLYDLVGIEGAFTDNRYGWTNISQASAVATRDGVVIRMPRIKPL